jgi:hypothetical protein
MFKLKTPCVTCPFKKGVGSRFRLHPERLTEIFAAPAFQCHKTVDYSDDEPAPGDKPQQCAGLMGLLLNADEPNQIMQVGMRLGGFDPDQIDRTQCYQTLADARRAHTNGNEPEETA